MPVTLRRTQKLARALPLTGAAAGASSTALGDWYANRLAEIVGARLRRAGIASRLIAAEVAAMNTVTVAKTTDRSVVGIMVDFAFATGHYLPIGGWDETTLPFVEARLAETPCYVSRRESEGVYPDRDTPARLAEVWGAG